MITIADHPDVKAMLETGYPRNHRDDYPECPYCHGAQTDWVFELDGDYVCRDCFIDWVKEYTSTNPREVALALSVIPKYIG